MKFSQQECWSRLPFPIPGDVLTQGLNLCLLHWQADLPMGKEFFTTESWNPHLVTSSPALRYVNNGKEYHSLPAGSSGRDTQLLPSLSQADFGLTSSALCICTSPKLGPQAKDRKARGRSPPTKVVTQWCLSGGILSVGWG